MADHQTMRARVRLYLDAGVSYNQAIYRANHEQQQPQPSQANFIRPCDCGRHVFPPCPNAVKA